MLKKLAENHKLWIRMVINMGCDPSIAEDIVQEMYLRIHRLVKDKKKIMYNDEEVNRFFIYVTLRNMYYDYTKLKNKYQFFTYIESDELDDKHYVEDEYNEEEHRGFEYIMGLVNEEISNWDRYDIILAGLYLKSDRSLRNISDMSGISLTSVFNSVKNYKRILKEKFGEEWEDYLNGDYHLLK
jgi:DNA-directed RNA polymerase specialized sigma24 family protein